MNWQKQWGKFLFFGREIPIFITKVLKHLFGVMKKFKNGRNFPLYNFTSTKCCLSLSPINKTIQTKLNRIGSKRIFMQSY